MSARRAYIDGNNNTYEIGDRLEYVPITPERSSSGSYSGGEPKSAALGAEQRARLISLLDQIAADTENLLDDRPKGSGTVIQGDQRAVCRGSSPLKQELETMLRGLLA
ncbi:MAG: hypothetical protein H0V17_09860 [Deltaproteobacteria bacterium]|nr:hypothetical protein [Deltaproteobacteria bacterium]